MKLERSLRKWGISPIIYQAEKEQITCLIYTYNILSNMDIYEHIPPVVENAKKPRLTTSAIINTIKLYHTGGQGMTPEQVKEKLEGVKWINKEIKGLYLELEALEGGIIKKPTLSHSRVQTSRENKAESDLISVLKLKEDTLQRIERLTEERMAISGLIDKLDNPLERSVLRLFYLNDLVALEVAEEIGKSKTAVYLIRQKAIEHLAGMVNGD